MNSTQDELKQLRQQAEQSVAAGGDMSALTQSMGQLADRAAAQEEQRIDLATDQAVAELEQARQQAQQQYQTQQDQIAIEEARALDDQVLYAEARGDRGGIGQSQYSYIRAAALASRQAVNTARTQMAADTTAQIARLRAQGEYDKADAVLGVTQSYLEQLQQLQQWNAQYALDRDKLEAQNAQWQAEYDQTQARLDAQNAQWQAEFDREQAQLALALEQWRAEYELAVSKLTGDYQGQATLTARAEQQELLKQSGLAALAVGVRPSAAQQQAMGYTDAQIAAALALWKAEHTAAAATTSSGSGTSGTGSSTSGSTSGGTSGSSSGGSSGSTASKPVTSATKENAADRLTAMSLTRSLTNRDLDRLL